MDIRLFKYPRTTHLEGSRLGPGDEDLAAVRFKEIAGRSLVVEEKLDGANAGVSFSPEGKLLLQSRGHYLTGGVREKHFKLFKAWANSHRDALWDRLSDRYVMYGEWLYAKHTIFYDALPHYFLEFDILDREQAQFLSTQKRHDLLTDSGVCSVPVLARGAFEKRDRLTELVGPSLFKSSSWNENLRNQAIEESLDIDRVFAETDPEDQAEGLYIKVEEDGIVCARHKFVRASFLTRVRDSGTHWLNRPILPNRLAPDVDLFGSHASP